MIYFEGNKYEEVRIPAHGKTPVSDVALVVTGTATNVATTLFVQSYAVQGDYIRVVVGGASGLEKGEYSYLFTFTDSDGESQSFAGLAIRTGSPAIDIEEAESEIQYIQYE